nr:uncharacterized protein LOC120362030 [Saimiri boliviensis boliviensis]
MPGRPKNAPRAAPRTAFPQEQEPGAIGGVGLVALPLAGSPKRVPLPLPVRSPEAGPQLRVRVLALALHKRSLWLENAGCAQQEVLPPAEVASLRERKCLRFWAGSRVCTEAGWSRARRCVESLSTGCGSEACHPQTLTRGKCGHPAERRGKHNRRAEAGRRSTAGTGDPRHLGVVPGRSSMESVEEHHLSPRGQRLRRPVHGSPPWLVIWKPNRR